LKVKTVDFNEVKRQEAQSRMAAARKARCSPQAAAAQQRRASLVGDGAKWRITNFNRSPAPCPNGRSRGFFSPSICRSLKIRDAAGQPYLLIGG
jgi:hypothetical protein